MTTHRDFRGAAVDGRVSGALGTGDTTIALKSSPGATGWPDGPSECVIDPGGTEEQIYFASRTGLTLSGVLRGQNNTVAVSHTDNAIIRHVGTKRDFQEANDHTSDTEADPHATKLLNTTRHDLTARHTIGTVVPAGTILDLGDTANGADNAAARAGHKHGFPAGTSYPPTWTGGSVGNGTLTGRYVKVGKWLRVHIAWAAGSTTSYGGSWAFSLPPGITSAPIEQYVQCFIFTASGFLPGIAQVGASATNVNPYSMAPAAGGANTLAVVTATYPVAWAGFGSVVMVGELEIA